MTDYDDLSGQEARPKIETAGDDELAYTEAVTLLEGTQSAPPPGRFPDDEISDELLGYDTEALASWNLKRIRTALGISQQQIADELAKDSPLGIRLSQSQIAKIERRERPWRVNELFAIAHVLNCRFDDFFQAQGVGEDSDMTMLVERIKYQSAEERAGIARFQWLRLARSAQEAANHYFEVAAKNGFKDPDVLRIKAASWLRSRDYERHQETVAIHRPREWDEAWEYALAEWERIRNESGASE